MAKTSARPVIIDVTSDFACPWCYVGYKRLENAIASSPVDVELRWHPYMIDMATKKDGEPYLAYNARRWGSDGWVGGMKRSALDDGCKFENWGRQNPNSVWANTLHAHRMMHFFKTRVKAGSSTTSSEASDDNSLVVAKNDAAGNRLKKRLLHEYYENGVNISLVPELLRIGKDALKEEGCATQAYENALETYMQNPDDGTKEVLGDDKAAKRRNVSGVPYFEVTGMRSGFSGAQPTEMWADLFQKLSAAQK